MKDDPKVIRFPKDRGTGTVEIQTHPDEVIDVDPQILAIMNARLAGTSFDDIYSHDDQVSDDLAIERELKKLRSIFSDAASVYEGFRSLDAIKHTKTKLYEHKVDRVLLGKYASQKAAGQPIDEADLYAHLVGGRELELKQKRLDALRSTPTLGQLATELARVVGEHYLQEGFGAFSVSKEMVALSPDLTRQLKNGELLWAVDEVLDALYGRTR